MKRLCIAVAAACVMFGAAAAADAQVGYFGQNKVQYRTFHFKVLKTTHFDVYYYPEEEDAARIAGRMAERWYTRLSAIFGHQMKTRQPLVLYASGSQFRQTNVVDEDLGEGVGGVTEPLKRRVVIPFAGPIEATDHVLGHELVHAFQYDITNTNGQSVANGSGGAEALPLWFIEGMAEYLSIGPDDPNTAMWMREAVRREKLPKIDDLNNPKYFPYRYGEALWAFIGGKYGDQKIGTLLRAASGRDGYKGAFQRVLGVTSKQLSEQWHEATAAAYTPIAETTKLPTAFARPVVVTPNQKGGYNVSPELSPDGSKIIYFSSRDLFSIDLYVGDTETGKVIRKITDTATNAHLDSIEFIESAGAWSHDGRRFAFPALAGGNPILSIFDVEDGHKERDIVLKDLDEVLNPTWSPDGNQIAFSGMVGGFDDLFIYDLQADKLRRLTHDAFAEVGPAWSPDGKSIAFSTDRFTTDLNELNTGNLRIATVDVASGEIKELGGFDRAKNINPQWSADSRSVYFVSDRQGISNIYRLDVDSRTPVQITNVLTGVSGITELSPALSISASHIAFSIYENDGFNIYSIDSGARAAQADNIVTLPRDGGFLPPRAAGEGPVYAYLHNDTAGLPAPAAATAFPTQSYKPKLSLDYLGQPVVGIGRDSFGTFVGGGVSAVFSDMLGNHTVGGAVQLTNRFDEAGFSLLYLNRTHRWNWGASVDQTPYVVRGFADTITATPAGQPLIEEDEFRTLQVDRGFSGIVVYPFSRAQRLEFSTGLRQITGKQDVTARLFDANTGQQLTQDTTTLNLFPTLNLGTASSALVYDTSIFGVTSPIRGSRYRLEYDQTYDLHGSPSTTLSGGTANTLTYGAALADYRTYLMPKRPFTVALRGMYYGRYGTGAESNLLTPVFIGYPDLVRGYDYGSFEAQECGTATNGSCPVFDRLLGSRMIVANAELRFPLWGAFGGSNFYGPLPIELAVFGDAGAAWDRSHSLHLTGTDRNLVRSYGAAARINLFGFAVGEIDYVHPMDRPLRGWIWEFNLRPGF